MRGNKKMGLKSRQLKISLLIIISILCLSFITQSTHSKSYVKTTSIGYSMEFIGAEYLDADEDGLEDDTRFFVSLYFDPTIFDDKLIKLCCFFEIITPSGIEFEYTGFIILQSVSCTIRFDVYDTVIEPGWYTINFNSTFQDKGLIYSSFCTTIFDPPTERPGGAPTIGL